MVFDTNNLCSFLLNLETPHTVRSLTQESYYIQATSKCSEQTVLMRRLVWEFAGCTYHIVGNLMSLKCGDMLVTQPCRLALAFVIHMQPSSFPGRDQPYTVFSRTMITAHTRMFCCNLLLSLATKKNKLAVLLNFAIVKNKQTSHKTRNSKPVWFKLTIVINK